MPAVGRARGRRRSRVRSYPPKRMEPLSTGRPRGGAKIVAGEAKTHLHVDPEGKKWYGKGRNAYYQSLAKDRRVLSKGKRSRKEGAWRGDLPGSRV